MTGWDAAFATPPPRWGLRGDPLLWDEMRASLSAAAVPDDRDEAMAMLRLAWETLTDRPLDDASPDGARSVRVERLDQGGMSGGHVSPPFWRDTAFPLILSRLFAA